jgi:hypothetical protein
VVVTALLLSLAEATAVTAMPKVTSAAGTAKPTRSPVLAVAAAPAAGPPAGRPTDATLRFRIAVAALPECDRQLESENCGYEHSNHFIRPLFPGAFRLEAR